MLRNPTLKRWAGTYGTIMVVRDGPAEPWRRLEGDWEEVETEDVQIDGSTSIKAGMKRPATATDVGLPDAKRPKSSSNPDNSSSTTCLAPPQGSIAGKVLAELEAAGNSVLGTGDVFLTEGFRARWCRCMAVSVI